MCVSKMKSSYTPWIGEIPIHWVIGRIDGFYTLRNTKVSDKDYQPLSVTMKGVLPQLETAAKTNAHDDRKLVRKGDFAINSRSDRRGSCGIAPYDGSVSLINTILAPKGEMNPEYYNWLFHTVQFADEFYKWGHGIVDDLWTTNYQDMKKINIPVPPLEEQHCIAVYLNERCAEIEALSADIQSEIDTLVAYKKSVITEAVTKGLDNCEKMRESGIDCLGTIPAHWEIKRAKYIATSITKGNGITKEQVFDDGDIQCVRYGEIYSSYDIGFYTSISRTKMKCISSPKYIQTGDILFAGTGELIEEIGKNIVYLGTDPCLAGGDIVVMRHKQNPSFLNYAMGSAYAQKQKSESKAKLKVVHISSTDIGNIRIAIPPRDEQDKIAAYIDDQVEQINGIIVQKQEQLAILADYKKSIIYEYVTGKKEVPNG